MLEEITISNYKSILNQRIRLGRVNVFIGRNGSGKTNILEAIGMASAAHDDAMDTDSLMKRGISVSKPSLTFHSPTYRKDQGNEINIVWYENKGWKKSKLVCDMSDDNNPLWQDISWYDPVYVDKINNLIRTISDGTIVGEYPFDDEARNTVLNAAFRGSRIFRDYIIYNANTNALQNNTGETLGEGLNNLLASFTEEQIQIIKSFGFTEDIFASNNMPALFYLALYISKSSPSFFAIDNFDELIAPELCRDLMNNILQLSIKNKKQSLITICNKSIVNGLDLNDPEQKIFLVKLAKDGQTIVEELKDKKSIEDL